MKNIGEGHYSRSHAQFHLGPMCLWKDNVLGLEGLVDVVFMKSQSKKVPKLGLGSAEDHSYRIKIDRAMSKNVFFQK